MTRSRRTTASAVPTRRSSDATKLTLSMPVVIGILVAAVGFGWRVQASLTEIQSSVQRVDAKIDKADAVTSSEMKIRDEKIEKNVNEITRHDIRLRTIETALTAKGILKP